MDARTLGFILASVALSSLAQFALRHGMAAPGVQVAIAGGGVPAIARAIVLSPAVVGGLAMYAAGAVSWLFVLSRLEVSSAYPFIGLGFLVTLALGAFVFGEAMTVPKVVGTLMVAGGIALVAVR